MPEPNRTYKSADKNTFDTDLTISKDISGGGRFKKSFRDGVTTDVPQRKVGMSEPVSQDDPFADTMPAVQGQIESSIDISTPTPGEVEEFPTNRPVVMSETEWE